MDKFKEIRPIVVGIVKNNGKILGMPGHNNNTNIDYYRMLGGGVEFLETLEVALKREFKEELGVEIKINKFLGFEDNIFVFDNKNAHEHVFLFDIEILDNLKEEYEFFDGVPHVASWIDIEDVKNGKIVVYPTITEKYI